MLLWMVVHNKRVFFYLTLYACEVFGCDVEMEQIPYQFRRVLVVTILPSQLVWWSGPSEYPLLEQNSEFFVLLEPYSEIFGI